MGGKAQYVVGARGEGAPGCQAVCVCVCVLGDGWGVGEHLVLSEQEGGREAGLPACVCWGWGGRPEGQMGTGGLCRL